MPQGVECTGLDAPYSTHAEMQKAVSMGRACGECGRLLQIAWGGAYGYNCYILTCGDVNHCNILRVEPKTKNQTEGEKIFRGYGMKALQTYTPQEMIARVNQAGLFPQNMNNAQRLAIADVCINYGLDPLMGELMIYQGRLYITVAARLRKAQEAGDFAGIATRAATGEEKASRGYLPEDFVMVAVAKKAVSGVLGEFEGWGVVTKAVADKADKHLPIGANPAQHAEKRAIARALRMAWHIPLPSAEDMGAEDNGTVRVVDVETGEVIEGTATELPPEPKKAKPQKATTAPTKAKAEVKGPAVATDPPAPDIVDQPPAETSGTPTSVKQLNEWAYSHGKDFVPTWVNKNVGGVQDTPEDVARAYNELKAITGWND